MRSKRVISVVGCHAEGEVGDVIIGGVLPPAGVTMFEKMRTMERDHDHVRRLLLCEPRGSVCRHVNLLVPPVQPGCDAGIIIMEATEYVAMSGSNLICTVTVLLEAGLVAMTEPETIVTVDTPAGPVRARAECQDGRCRAVEFENVPAFVDRLDAPLEVEGYGTVSADIAYGGMFYAVVDATRLGFSITPDEARELAVLGERVRLAAREQLSVVHPGTPGISGVSIVQLNRPFAGVGAVTRNTCIVAPGRSDRSPTGTGTSARMAVLHARGQMRTGRHGARVHYRQPLRRPDREGNRGRRAPRHRAGHQGPRLDHRAPHLLPGPGRSVSGGLPGPGHLGRDGDTVPVTRRHEGGR